ncbi:hypothetical protein IT411_00720 [Candidatus Peregrinibacteria bacterium]|nr:hypothetical protein [Candidatus Peregrinibacteria bacterium]
MPATFLFTTQELEQLINRSKAMATFSAQDKAKILHGVTSPDSAKAQELYQILIQERDTYRSIERDYLSKTNAILQDFHNEITHLKTEKLRAEQQKTESAAASAEAETAEALLKKLNQ